MKIGILGGTFSPIHRAHIQLGRQAMDRFGLDRILVMPTGNSYFKTVSTHVVDAHYRLEMMRLAIRGEEHFLCSEMETRRRGNTYTSDTLLQLTREMPGTEFFLIVGADSLHTLKYWHAPEVILRHAEVICAHRRTQVDESTLEEDRRYLEERYGARIHLMDFRGMDISSTQLREEIRTLGPDPEKIPEKVCQYIRRHHLYGAPLTPEEIHRDLQQRLKPSRYAHTLGVMESALRLAERYAGEAAREISPLHGSQTTGSRETFRDDFLRRASLAALVHDCGKYEGTALTHGPVGARIALDEYGITDPEILSAVTWHTTGRPAMSVLEKILFVADYIEPGRDKAPRLEEMRRLAMEDLDAAVREILRDTLDYLRRIGADIDTASLRTFEYYESLTSEKGE